MYFTDLYILHTIIFTVCVLEIKYSTKILYIIIYTILLYVLFFFAVPLHAMEALGGRGGIAPTHSRPRH
jgi:isoprenylcysteine carboxyl methyltransferase (ICMT) family protein YpbQ